MLENIVKNSNLYFAHIKNNENELLQDHIKLTNFYYKKIKNQEILNKIFKMLNLKIDQNLIDNIITYHDYGKINPLFQKLKLNNDIEDLDLEIGTSHSILSSFLYVYDNIKDDDIENYIIFLNAFIISRHHSPMSNFSYNSQNFIEIFTEDELFEKTMNLLKNDKNIKDDYIKDEKLEFITDKAYDLLDNYPNLDTKILFIYQRYMESLLIASDFYSTSNFMENVEIDFKKLDISNFKNAYKNSYLYKKIKNKEYDKPIDKLRNEIFNESKKNLNNKNIHFLESPTSSGKTNMALNLTFKLLKEDRNKIIYTYPFNTLIEQNKKTLYNIFDKNLQKEIKVVNSVTEIKKNDYYEKTLLERDFLNYNFLITSNVLFFDILFSNKRKHIGKLYNIENSVIVIDEIQYLKNSLRNEITTMLDLYAKIFNIKFIMMSATLPKLDKLLEDNKNINYLIKDPKKYFTNPIFKNRVKIDYSLLQKRKIDYETLKDFLNKTIKKDQKVLVEFITKKDAENFYKILDIKGYEIKILTGDDSLKKRDEIIKNFDKNQILISTQILESGIDIDSDVGFKDISSLESEEQLMGRINRNNLKKDSTIYFFDMFDERKIYKDLDTNLTLKNEDRKKDLLNKDFTNYFNIKINKAKVRKNLSYKDFLKDLKENNFENIKKHMVLIDNYDKINLYLGDKSLWYEYKNLFFDKSLKYSEKKIKLFNKRIQLNENVFEISKNDFNRYIGRYDDKIGDIYFIKDYKNYLLNDRLNLKEDVKDDII